MGGGEVGELEADDVTEDDEGGVVGCREAFTPVAVEFLRDDVICSTVKDDVMVRDDGLHAVDDGSCVFTSLKKNTKELNALQ